MRLLATLVSLSLTATLGSSALAQSAAPVGMKVDEGFYVLVHQSSNQALDIEGDKDGTVVRAKAKARFSADAQRFYLRPWTDNRVVISARTKKWQVLSSNASWVGDPVRSWAWMTSPDQMWVVSDAGNGLVRIRHNEKGLALGLEGSNVVLKPDGDLWRLVPDLSGCQFVRQFHGQVFIYAQGPGRGLGVGAQRTYAPEAGLFRFDVSGDPNVPGLRAESCKYPNHYIHINAQGELALDKNQGSAAFLRASTFMFVASQSRRWAYESASNPGQYLRICGNRLVLDSWDTPGPAGCADDRWSFAHESSFLQAACGISTKTGEILPGWTP